MNKDGIIEVQYRGLFEVDNCAIHAPSNRSKEM